MSCMNRVYLRGCEAKYLESLLGGTNFCEKAPETRRRVLGESDEHEEVGVRSGQERLGDDAKLLNGPAGRASGRGRRGGADQGKHPEVATRRLSDPNFKLRNDANGSAGSLVIHIRSGDIFSPANAVKMKASFPAYGQVRELAIVCGREVARSSLGLGSFVRRGTGCVMCCCQLCCLCLQNELSHRQAGAFICFRGVALFPRQDSLYHTRVIIVNSLANVVREYFVGAKGEFRDDELENPQQGMLVALLKFVIQYRVSYSIERRTTPPLEL